MNLQIVCEDSPVDTTLREASQRQRLIAALGGGVTKPIANYSRSSNIPQPNPVCATVRVGHSSASDSKAHESISPVPLVHQPKGAPTTSGAATATTSLATSASASVSVPAAANTVNVPLIVTTTGFSIEETRQLQQLLQSAGHVYTASLTRQTQIVVANTFESHKYKLAVSHNILVVSPRWVLDFQCASDVVMGVSSPSSSSTTSAADAKGSSRVTVPSTTTAALNGLLLHPLIGTIVSSTSLTLKDRTDVLQRHVSRSFCGIVLQPELDKYCKYLIVPDNWDALLAYNGYYKGINGSSSSPKTENEAKSNVGAAESEAAERLGRSSLPLTNASSVSPDSKAMLGNGELTAQQKQQLKTMEENPKYKFAIKHAPNVEMIPLRRFVVEVVWGRLFASIDKVSANNNVAYCSPSVWIDRVPMDLKDSLVNLTGLGAGRATTSSVTGRRLFGSEVGEGISATTSAGASTLVPLRTSTAISLKTTEGGSTTIPKNTTISNVAVATKPAVIYICHAVPNQHNDEPNNAPTTPQAALLAEAEQICSILGFVRVPTMVRRVTHVIALDPAAVVLRDKLFEDLCTEEAATSNATSVPTAQSGLPLQHLDSTFMTLRTTRTAQHEPSGKEINSGGSGFSFDIVTIDWLRQCAKEMSSGSFNSRQLPKSTPFLFRRPTLTFTGMPRTSRKVMAMIASELGAIVMDDLVVGSLNPAAPTTTHLVVGMSGIVEAQNSVAFGAPTISQEVASSAKVQAILKRHKVGKTSNCSIVTEAWLQKCQSLRTWVPVSYPADAIEDGSGVIELDRIKEPAAATDQTMPRISTAPSADAGGVKPGAKRPREEEGDATVASVIQLKKEEVEVLDIEDDDDNCTTGMVAIEEDAFAALLQKLDAAVPTSNSTSPCYKCHLPCFRDLDTYK